MKDILLMKRIKSMKNKSQIFNLKNRLGNSFLAIALLTVVSFVTHTTYAQSVTISVNATITDNMNTNANVLVAGNDINYHVMVRNTGGVALTNVTFTNTLGVSMSVVSGDTTNPGVFDIDEVWTYTGTHLLTAMDFTGADVVNTFSANADEITTAIDFIHTREDSEDDFSVVEIIALNNIDAIADDFSATPIISKLGGNTASVEANDEINGGPANAADVVASYVSVSPTPGTGGFTINASGEIVATAGTTAGTYTITYKLCETANTANCDITTAIVEIEATPQVQFTATTSGNAEDTASVNIAVELASASSQAVTVSFTVGTESTAATPGTDYTAFTPLTVTIPSGMTTANIPLTGIVDDLLNEVDETVTLVLTPATGSDNFNLGTNTTHVYTITDNDNAPVVAFTATSSAGAESVATANLEVSLSAASGQDVSVAYTVLGTSTAANGGVDYVTLADGTATITAGDTTTDIAITGIVDDMLNEANETIVVQISTPTNATLGTNTVHTYTINDNDAGAIPTIAFNSAASSNGENTANANIAVDLSGASGQTITVDYAVTGTATGGGTDYTLANGTLTINAGDLSEDITIASIVDDALPESNETVILTLSNPTNATLGTNTVHTYTITDNDSGAVPSIAFNAVASNNAEDTASADIAVDLSGVSGQTITVDYAVTGTATGSGTDYTLANGTLTINAGDLSEDITIASIVDDALTEDNETVILTLSNPSNATLGTNTVHTYTINDNDAANEPTIAFNSTASANGEDTASADIAVDLSGVSGQAITVDYAVTGTATGTGTDYTLANGTLTINAGDLSEDITIARTLLSQVL